MSEPYKIELEETGGPDVLQFKPLELRKPNEGEVLVRQTAVGLNFVDTYFRSGLYPARLPHVLGSEGAGVVEAVGADVENVKPGDRVAHLSSGTYASHVIVPADRLVKLPDDISETDAAALMLKGLTAWMLIFEIRPITAEDTVLIWAPVGGVGSVLLPWVKSIGANVIAVTSSQKKADLAREAGADYVIIGYDDVAAQVKAITGGKGVDVSLDSVGKISAKESLASLKPRGWFITYGNASGPVDPIPPVKLSQGGSLVMTRPTLFNFIATAEDLQRGAKQMFEAVAAGVIKANVGQERPLKDVGSAHQDLESGQTIGATVLIP